MYHRKYLRLANTHSGNTGRLCDKRKVRNKRDMVQKDVQVMANPACYRWIRFKTVIIFSTNKKTRKTNNYIIVLPTHSRIHVWHD